MKATAPYQSLWLYFILTILIPRVATAAMCTKHKIRRIASYDDKSISQYVVWTVPSPGKMECMIDCVRDQYCASFHYNALQNTCVALGKRFDGTSVSTQADQGNLLYETEKGLLCGIDY